MCVHVLWWAYTQELRRNRQRERFVASFCLRVYPPPLFFPPPQQVLLSSRVLVSSSFCVCPILPSYPLHPLLYFSLFYLCALSVPPLAARLCSRRRRLGAIAANQTVYPSLISVPPHGEELLLPPPIPPSPSLPLKNENKNNEKAGMSECQD